jgi:hypothetical protein
MNGFWTAIGAAGAAGAVLLGMIVHIVTYAYQRGRTDNRLEALEKSHSNHATTDKLIASLTAMVEALKDSVERLDHAVVEINGRMFRGRES